jgi:hypothetical protein
MSSKRIEIYKKNLKFSENNIEMPRILKKSLAFSKKASWQLPHYHNGQSSPDFEDSDFKNSSDTFYCKEGFIFFYNIWLFIINNL